jgi:hypothetical protein
MHCNLLSAYLECRRALPRRLVSQPIVGKFTRSAHVVATSICNAPSVRSTAHTYISSRKTKLQVTAETRDVGEAAEAPAR